MTNSLSRAEKIADELGGDAMAGMALSRDRLCQGQPNDVLSDRWRWIADRGASLSRATWAFESGWPVMSVAEGFAECVRTGTPLPEWISSNISEWLFSGEHEQQRKDERRDLEDFIRWRTTLLLRFELHDFAELVTELMKAGVWTIRNRKYEQSKAEELAGVLRPYVPHLLNPSTNLEATTALAAKILSDVGLAYSEGTVRQDAKKFAKKLRQAVCDEHIQSVGPPFLPSKEALNILKWIDLDGPLDLGMPIVAVYISALRKLGFEFQELMRTLKENPPSN